MKTYLVIPVILFSTFIAEANQEKPVQADTKQHYDKCVAASLYTLQGRELNSIVKSNRAIDETNLIPEGWTVIGITTKEEAGVTTPFLVICH